jgi:phosphopantothenoylcysteine decarboxylase
VANVLLGVTGSVAALKIPELFAALTLVGHRVRVVATKASLYFLDPQTLDPSRAHRNPEVVVLDEDEWPGLDEGRLAKRGDLVLHIELRKWADLLLVAPLDANTLAKFANGLADNCLTCVYRAWNPARPILLAPAMNTFMWEHPATQRHLNQLAADAGASAPPSGLTLKDLVDWINRICPRLRIVPPQSKRLFCGDVGVGAMAELHDIVAAVNESVGGRELRGTMIDEGQP